jgi:hypothetical protein
VIELALRDLLLQAPAIAALVGTRVHPVILPQAPVYPAITYQQITGLSHYSQQGPSALADTRFQLDLYAGSHTGVLQLRDAVMQRISGAQGLYGSPPVQIQGAFRSMERDAYEQQLERSGPTVWRKSLDFNIWFTEVYNG